VTRCQLRLLVSHPAMPRQPSPSPSPSPEPSPEPEQPPGQPVEHVLSLGALCFTAAFMQKHRLRPFAGPFDWLFSSPRMVAHCIEDRFRTFLDASQYTCLHAGKAGHRLYGPMVRGGGGDVIFNHHNPALPQDYQHFRRAAARFMAQLSAPGHKLLLLVSKGPGLAQTGTAAGCWLL
jgi:hypothetical protein